MKNVIGFSFSFFNVKFNEDHGSKIGFITYGCIELFIGMLSIPLYIYGKIWRKWTDDMLLLEFSISSRNNPTGEEEDSYTSP